MAGGGGGGGPNPPQNATGVRTASVASTIIAHAAVSHAASPSGMALITPPLFATNDAGLVHLFAYFALTLAADMSTIAWQLYRGPSLTSPTILGGGGAQPVAGVGTVASVCVDYFDEPGVVDGQIYGLAVWGTDGSSDGTLLDACLIALAL